MAERRDLTFSSLDDVMIDVDRLLTGYVTVGNWSLAQVCYHLATAIRLTLDTPPGSSGASRDQDVARRLFFRRGKFPEGMAPPDPVMVPGPDLDALTEVAYLRCQVARFATIPGPFPDHPRLGPMNRDEWARFHHMHCAHHLSFVVPIDARTSAG